MYRLQQQQQPLMSAMRATLLDSTLHVLRLVRSAAASLLGTFVLAPLLRITDWSRRQGRRRVPPPPPPSTAPSSTCPTCGTFTRPTTTTTNGGPSDDRGKCPGGPGHNFFFRGGGGEDRYRSGSGPSSYSYSSIHRSVQVDFRPRRIILLRHGESLGNVDESAYVKTADWRIPLTARGREQASDAGRKLRELVGDTGKVFFYYSPYRRTRETLDEIIRYFDDNDATDDDGDVDDERRRRPRIVRRRVVSVREEPRISEQQVGNFQNVESILAAKTERARFGRFYYRFPSGEAGLDVYSRVSSFITTLVRDCHQYNDAGYDLDDMTVVIVTHGLALRLFLMRWFQFSVEEFEMSDNPGNAELVTMCKKYGEEGPSGSTHKWFELIEADRQSLNLPECCGVPKNVQLHELRGVNG